MDRIPPCEKMRSEPVNNCDFFRRNTVPSIATLEEICKGFGITLSQFFADEEMVELTPDLKTVFDCWVNLTPSQKHAAVAMLRAMNQEME